jgi:hypothetical protein
VPAEESFSPEDEAFFQGAEAADSVRPVTLSGHEAPAEEADASALSRPVHSGRFVRPVQRVVVVLAVISAAALMREALRSPADGLAVATAHLAPNATPASDIDALADDLIRSVAQAVPVTDDSNASTALEQPFAFIGPPAPPALSTSGAPAPAPCSATPSNPRVNLRAKVAITTVRAAPTKASARTKSLSTAALLHALRAQHAKGPLHK